MNEKIELLKHIYQDSDMSCYTIKCLSKDLKNKDNKIKNVIDDIYKEYSKYKKESKNILKKYKASLDKNSLMSKVMAGIGIKKNVLNDNSDSAIADLLIQGISMGSINMEKKIDDYKSYLSEDELKLAEKFLTYQQESIEKLKKYL